MSQGRKRLPEILIPLVERIQNSSLDELQELVSSYGIDLVETHLPEGKNGMYLETSESRVIFISKSLTTAQKRTTIVHEFIHAILHTNVGPLYSYNSIWRDRFEREAEIYTARILIPEDRFKRLLSMGYPVSQIAEELSVSEELIEIALRERAVCTST